MCEFTGNENECMLGVMPCSATVVAKHFVVFFSKWIWDPHRLASMFFAPFFLLVLRYRSISQKLRV